MTKSDEYSDEKMQQGDYGQQLIIDWLSDIGYYPELYVDRNGGAQIYGTGNSKSGWILDPRPDINVYLDEKHVNLSFLVESKTMKSPYTIYRSFLKSKMGLESGLKYGDAGVTVPTYQFDGYARVCRDIGKIGVIIFIIMNDNSWWWQNINKMDKTKYHIGKGYEPKDNDRHYFWKFEDLRNDFKGR